MNDAVEDLNTLWNKLLGSLTSITIMYFFDRVRVLRICFGFTFPFMNSCFIAASTFLLEGYNMEEWLQIYGKLLNKPDSQVYVGKKVNKIIKIICITPSIWQENFRNISKTNLNSLFIEIFSLWQILHGYEIHFR